MVHPLKSTVDSKITKMTVSLWLQISIGGRNIKLVTHQKEVQLSLTIWIAKNASSITFNQVFSVGVGLNKRLLLSIALKVRLLSEQLQIGKLRQLWLTLITESQSKTPTRCFRRT